MKYLQSLRLKKFRQKYNNFVVEGDKIAKEFLKSKPEDIELVVALETWLEGLDLGIPLPGEKIAVALETELEKISQLSTPNQVFLVARQPEVSVDPVLIRNTLSLYLDGIQDPGNLGTILRVADWFGISYVFCSPTCADCYHPKVLQASMGAFLRVHCLEMDFGALLEAYPDLPVLGAVLEGSNIFQSQCPERGFLVIGNESQGISAPIKSRITYPLTIPRGPGGGAESLNAAIATGIICAVLRGKMSHPEFS